MNATAPATSALLLRYIVESLPRFAYRFANETALHDGIAEVLDAASISYYREFVAGPKDRFDFLVPPGIVIEAKIKGSLSPALAQISRYAARDDVSAVVLVATRQWALSGHLPAEIHGKPIHMVKLTGASF